MRTAYKTFSEVAKALGYNIKMPTPKPKEARKCPVCGNPMRHIEGTNVYLCEMSLLTEEELNGQVVQVFTPCGTRDFADD